MIAYEFKCRICGCIFEDVQDKDNQFFPPCPDCGGKTYKLFTRSKGLVVQEYYSPSLGKVVRGRHHLKELRKEISEEYTNRTGIEMTVGGDSV